MKAVLYDVEHLDKSIAVISGLHGIPESTVAHWAEKCGIMEARKKNLNYRAIKTECAVIRNEHVPNEVQKLLNGWRV